MRPCFAAAFSPQTFRGPRRYSRAPRRSGVRMGSSEGRRLVLVCDVLDTLVADPFSRGMHAHFGFADMASFLRAKQPGTWEAFERGEVSEAELGRTFFRDGRSADVPALKAFLRDSYTLLPGAARLLADFRAARVPVHLCSNYGPWDPLVEAAVGLAGTHGARWTFVSAAHGVRKPDAAAFEKTAKLAGVSLSECVLLDDLERNCAGARDAGYRAAVKFSDTEHARIELANIFGDWLLEKDQDRAGLPSSELRSP